MGSPKILLWPGPRSDCDVPKGGATCGRVNKQSSMRLSVARECSRESTVRYSWFATISWSKDSQQKHKHHNYKLNMKSQTSPNTASELQMGISKTLAVNPRGRNSNVHR